MDKPEPEKYDVSQLCFRAEKFVLCAVVGGDHYKLVQVIFQRTDGSVFVSFPYYRHTTGLVSVATIEAHGSQMELKPGGKIASHLVKYVHHPDGEAHFSQTGKVFTAVRRKAVPLDQAGGHLFTAHAVGFDAFDTLTDAERQAAPTKRRTILNFDFGQSRPLAVKVVAQLYPSESFAIQGAPPTTPSPGPVPVVVGGSVARLAFFVSPPVGRSGANRILVLTAEEWIAEHGDGPSLSFIGGFDPPEHARDVARSTEVLALTYPVESVEALREEIGTIDFAAEARS